MSVDIISKSDPSYLNWAKRSIIEDKRKNRGRIKDPAAANHQQLMRELEAATLRMIKAKIGAETEVIIRRINKTGNRIFYEFYETDFAIFANTEPVLFGELKISGSPKNALKTARKQLRKRIDIVNEKWPGTCGMVVFYDLDYENNQLSYNDHDELIHPVDIAHNDIHTFIFRISDLYDKLVHDDYLRTDFKIHFKESINFMKNPLGKFTQETTNTCKSSPFDSITLKIPIE